MGAPINWIPQLDRELLHRRTVLNQTLDEIAAVMGHSVNALRRRLHRLGVPTTAYKPSSKRPKPEYKALPILDYIDPMPKDVWFEDEPNIELPDFTPVRKPEQTYRSLTGSSAALCELIGGPKK